MSIYIFPYMAQNINFNATSITRSLLMHKILLNSIKETIKFIPEYKYINKKIGLDDICGGGNIFGNNGVLEKLNNYEGYNIEQIDRLKYLDELNSNLNSLNNINIESKELLNKETIRKLIDLNGKYIKKIQHKEYKKDYIKCIEIIDEDISLNYEWIETINSNSTSLINIVKIFKEITDIGLVIDKNCFNEKYGDDRDVCPLDYFVFNKNGDLKYFIGFNTLHKNQKYFNKKTNKMFLTQNNLSCLLNFISMIRNALYLKNVDNSSFINKSINIIVNNKSNITSFQQIIDIIEVKNKKHKSNEREMNIPKKKIGIFLDTANIYTGIRDLEIDFDYLLISIYGIEALKQVKLKKATIVYQQNKNGTLKNNEYNKRNKKIEANLKEKYGFDIKTLYTKKYASEQIDDKALIEIITKNIHAVDKVLLMTGDKHFKEIIDLCKKNHKEIKVISVSEKDTSNSILSQKHHSCIYEYWDCIRLYRG